MYKIVKNVQNCAKLFNMCKSLKLCEICKRKQNVQNCPKYALLCKICKIIKMWKVVQNVQSSE